jgi:hypothetical protein
MLKFFRQIRKKLIIQENVRKYLLYALGEVLLVMIGILLALQVNNWNQDRIAASEQAIILKNLNVEFSENLVELTISISRLDTLIVALEELLNVMHNQPDTFSVNEFEILLERTFFTPTYSPSSFVLEELKNSGGLSRLNNQLLESLLFDWERQTARLRNSEKGFQRYGEEYIGFLTEFGSVRNLDAISGTIPTLKKSTITNNKVDLIENPVFENKADNFYFLAHLVQSNYSEAAKKMTEIIRITDN